MKLVIVINQQAAAAMGDLDLIDCAILDWLTTICNSRNERVAAERWRGKTWVNYHKLMTDMPLLGFSTKSAVSKRLKKLQQHGYLTLQTHQQRTYIDITPKCERLTLDRSQPFPRSNTAGKTVSHVPRSRFPQATNNPTRIINYKKSGHAPHSNDGYRRAKARATWLKSRPGISFDLWYQQQ